MANSSSLYGSTPPSGTVSSSNYTTLYSGGNNFVPSGDNVIISGTLTVNGCAILTDCNTFSLLPFNATTVNAFGSATAVSIGGATGVTTIQNQLATGNYLFPLADGAQYQIMISDGAGNLSWTNVGNIYRYAIQADSVPAGAQMTLSGYNPLQPFPPFNIDSITFASGTNVTVSRTNDSTITFNATDTNTTYTQNASATTGGANLNLVGSDSTIDPVKFASGTGISVVRTDADTITITNTDPGSATVTSITGTPNQIIASAATGAVTLSTPQDIATTSNPTFASVSASIIQADELRPLGPTDTNVRMITTGSGTYQTGKADIVVTESSSYPNGIASIAVNSNLWDFTSDGTTYFPNYIFPSADGSNDQILATDGSGYLSWVNRNPFDQDLNTTDYVEFAGVTAGNITVGVSTDNTITTTTGNLVLNADSNLVNVTAAFQVGTDTLYADSGKVGVNTTTPGQEFTISDGGDGYCQFGMTNTERTWLLTNNAGDDLISYSIYTPSTMPVNRLQFDATGGNQWFNSGRLGVNTSAPAVELDVAGSGQFSGDVAVNGGDLTTTATTASLFSTNARTIQIGGAGTNNATTDNITLGVYGQTYAVYVNTLLTQRGITTKASGQYLNQTTTSPILIMSTTRTSMKSIVTITDDVTGAIHTVECLANRKGLAGGAFITIYGEVYSDAPLATFTVVNNGVSGLELYATLASTNSTDIYITRDSLGAVI